MGKRNKAKCKKHNNRKVSRHEKEFFVRREYGDYLLLEEEVRTKTMQMDCAEGARGMSGPC